MNPEDYDVNGAFSDDGDEDEFLGSLSIEKDRLPHTLFILDDEENLIAKYKLEA